MTFDEPSSVPDESGATEWDLVYDAWANSFRKSPWAGCVPNHLWDQVSRASASEIINRGARVIVTVTPLYEREAEFPAVRRVMGYSVSEPQKKVLHWLYVKADYRGTGVGRALLAETCPGTGWHYTHRTKASTRFLGDGFIWSPHLARVKQ